MTTAPDTGRGLRAGATLALWVWACPAALAGPVEAVSGAAGGGSSTGLRVHVNPKACSFGVPNELEISQDIGNPGDFEACELLSADNMTVQASAEDVGFSAGYRVALGAEFGVERGAEFRVSVDNARVRGGFVRDDSPADEPHYAVRFLMNPDNLSMGTEERLVLFEAEDRLGRRWLALHMRDDGTRLLRVSAADGAATAEGAEFAVTSGWQIIELEWWASDPGASDGRVTVLQDGVTRSGLDGLANENGRIHSVRWGLLRALTSTEGHLDLDEFVSRRAGIIGPP